MCIRDRKLTVRLRVLASVERSPDDSRPSYALSDELVSVSHPVTAIIEHTNMHNAMDSEGSEPSPTSGDTIPAVRNCSAPIAPEPAPISRTASTPRLVALPSRSPVADVITKRRMSVGQSHGPSRASISKIADVAT